MRKVEELRDYFGDTVFVDMDKIVYMEVSDAKDVINFTFIGGETLSATVPDSDTETKEEGIQRVIDRWTCNRGRPEFIEGWFDTEGPKEGGGKYLIDLSAAVTFCYGHGFYGRNITIDFAEGAAHQRHTFWLKPDPEKTPEEQGAELEARWRRSRGEKA